MRKVALFGVGLLGIIALLFTCAVNPVQVYYQIQTDTIQIKNIVAPQIGMTEVAIDTFGDAIWQNNFGTPVFDSIATSGAKVTLAANTSYVITSSGTITADTLSFPAGKTGQWILVNFAKANSAITNYGTSYQLIGLTASTAGQTKIYQYVNSYWR